MKSVLFNKLIRHYLFLFLSIIISYTSQAQLFQLPKEWKFKLGDNINWANESFNDTGWGNKQVGTSWSATGMKDNVYAWYRIKIIIPSSMKSSAQKSN